MKNLILLPLILLLAVSTVFAQTDTSFLYKTTAIATKLLADKAPEKVYLHLNKPSYYPGDTIWFKAYTVVGDKHQLSGGSGVLYAELIKPNDSVVYHINLKLTNGLAYGEFPLKADAPAGVYRVRAYTNWMRNWGSEYFFDQPVIVGDASAVAVPPTMPFNVTFKPEGSEQPVAGLRSRVAVKCVAANGFGLAASGKIMDADNNQVAEFKTQHAGLAVFAFTPEAGKTYHADVVIADGRKQTIQLPVTAQRGFTLLVNKSGPDSIYLKVAASEAEMKASQHNTFYLVAQQGGRVCYTASFKLEDPIFSTTIDKKRFGSGVAQFMLFGPNADLLNQRIAFIRTGDTLATSLKLNTQTAAARGKMELAIKAGAGKPALGSFSVSVVSLGQMTANIDYAPTIESQLLLSSDVKSWVEDPGYYFSRVVDLSESDFDILMMSQIYKHDWVKYQASALDTNIYKLEKGLTITGVIKTLTGKPLPNGHVSFLDLPEKVMIDTTGDANGHFRLTDINISDTVKVVIKGTTKRNGPYVKVQLDRPDIPTLDKIISLPAPVKAPVTAPPELQPIILNMELLKAFPSIAQGLTHASAELKEVDGKLRYQDDLLRVVIDSRPFGQAELRYFSPFDLEAVSIIPSAGIAPDGKKISPVLNLITKAKAGTNGKQLKEVKVTSTRYRKPVVTHSENLNGPGVADQVIKGDDLVGSYTISQLVGILRGGIWVTTSGVPINPHSAKSPMHAGPMSVILDGEIINDPGELSAIFLQNIAIIEVLSSPRTVMLYGDEIGSGGAIIITTKTPEDMGPNDYLSGFSKTRVSGLHVSKQFYSPVYNTPKKATDAPDLRDAIYWNSDVATDDDGKAALTWYNSDAQGTYEVIIEGIDVDGHLTHATLTYKVE